MNSKVLVSFVKAILMLPFITGVVQAQVTIFLENFDSDWSTSSPPAGWKIEYDSPALWDDWFRNTWSLPPGGSGACALLWNFPIEIGNDRLISPVINCSGYSGVQLVLDEKWDPGLSSYFAQIQGSLDGGTNWNCTVEPPPGYHKQGTSQIAKFQQDDRVYNISWADNQPNVRIRFNCEGNNSHFGNWFVDNFIVRGTPCAADVQMKLNSLFLSGTFTGLAAGQVWCGAAYTLRDTVFNSGPASANAVMTTAYIDAWSAAGPSIASLASGAQQQVSVAPWTASLIPNTTHNRRDTTWAASPIDPDLTNNRRTATYTAVYDGETVSIDAPPDTVFTGTGYTPAATVRNSSAAGAATFDVTCTITPGGYTSTRTVTNLAAGSTYPVTFAGWTSGLAAGVTYTMTTTCQTLGDNNTANNTKTKSIFVYGDIGATDAIAPLDTVYVNTEYNPTVRIKNLTPGITEPFTVVCRILDPAGGVIYTDTRSDSLTASAEKFKTFKPWTVGPDTGISYELQANTQLPGDCIPDNDKVIWHVVSANPPSLDVGVSSIDEPTGNLIVGTTYHPKATVRNYGTTTTNFNVSCVIGGQTSIRGVQNLAKNVTQQLTFDAFTPISEGDITMTVITQLSDANPRNDTMTQTFSARSVNEPVASPPRAFALEAGRPNPFSALSDIRYALPVSTTVTLAVYDATGKVVQTLAAGVKAAGYYSVSWNGCDASGNSVPNGLYFIRMVTSKYTAVGKIVLMR